MELRKLLVGLFCVVSFSAQAVDVPIKEGMPFVSARKALINSGWKPNPTYAGEFGVESILVRKGYSEIESCTEGVRYCSFNYIKDGVCLGVGAVGEEVKGMKVYAWAFKCPGKE